MKQFSLLMVLVLITTFTSVHAFEKTVITLACFPPLDRAFEQILPEFYKQHPNIEIKIVSKGYGDHHFGLIDAFKDGNEIPDIAAVEIGYLSHFMALDALENLSSHPYRAKKLRRLIAPYKWAQANDEKGHIRALPLDITPGCVYWRRDKFAEAGVRIEDIRTMDDLFTAAGKLTRDMDGDGRIDQWFMEDSSDIAIMIIRSSDHPLLTFRNRKPTLDKERLKTAFTWARQFKNARYDAGMGPWCSTFFDQFERIISFKISGSWLAGHLESWMAPKTYGQWGVSRLPSLSADKKPMAANWGGSFLTIPRNAKHKMEAWEFIQFVCANKQSQLALFKTADSLPALGSAWKDPVFDEKLGFLDGQKARRLWIDIANEIPSIQSSQYDFIVNEAVGRELASVLYEGKNINRAIDDIENMVERKIH